MLDGRVWWGPTPPETFVWGPTRDFVLGPTIAVGVRSGRGGGTRCERQSRKQDSTDVSRPVSGDNRGSCDPHPHPPYRNATWQESRRPYRSASWQSRQATYCCDVCAPPPLSPRAGLTAVLPQREVGGCGGGEGGVRACVVVVVVVWFL